MTRQTFATLEALAASKGLRIVVVKVRPWKAKQSFTWGLEVWKEEVRLTGFCNAPSSRARRGGKTSLQAAFEFVSAQS